LIRIVGVQRSHFPAEEFVLLQNQGSMRICLRGHLILSENGVESGECAGNVHIFSEDALIPAGMYVLLYTGEGVSRWAKTKEGSLVYYTFMNKEESIWHNSEAPLHLLSTQHSFTERRDAMLLRR
jgi:hypothetical protein